MRKFTVTLALADKPAMVIMTDYMTRDSSWPNPLRFWVKGRHWWNRRRLVGVFESKVYAHCSSEELIDDQEFLHKAGVRP